MRLKDARQLKDGETVEVLLWDGGPPGRRRWCLGIVRQPPLALSCVCCDDDEVPYLVVSVGCYAHDVELKDVRRPK